MINAYVFFQKEKPKHRKKAVIASSESENETESTQQPDNETVQSDSSLDEDENHQWETLKDKAHKEKQNRRANAYNKYYYDWGTKYVGESNIQYLFVIVWLCWCVYTDANTNDSP